MVFPIYGVKVQGISVRMSKPLIKIVLYSRFHQESIHYKHCIQYPMEQDYSPVFITQCKKSKAMWCFILSLLIRCEPPIHLIGSHSPSDWWQNWIILTGWYMQGKQAEQHTREGNTEPEIEKEGKQEREAGRMVGRHSSMLIWSWPSSR